MQRRKGWRDYGVFAGPGPVADGDGIFFAGGIFAAGGGGAEGVAGGVAGAGG
jgi:hypothetical protein